MRGVERREREDSHHLEIFRRERISVPGGFFHRCSFSNIWYRFVLSPCVMVREIALAPGHGMTRC